MLVRDIFSSSRKQRVTPFSFEFFPPKTEAAWEQLYKTMRELLPLGPAYVSVTYGAGGSTRKNTHNLVSRLQGKGLPVVAHLSCAGSSEGEIARILQRYDEEGVHNILAIRGDGAADGAADGTAGAVGAVGADGAATGETAAAGKTGREGMAGKIETERFSYAADLVAYIKSHYPHFGVGVAGFPEGHPASPNRLIEMDYLKAKVDAGADYIVTQLFFDNRDFYDFRERCALAGIHIPVIAGLMPITTIRGMERMAELSVGSRFPAALLRRLQLSVNNNGGRWERYGAGKKNSPRINTAIARVGEHWCSEQISDLLNNGTAGIHLYTLNNSRASLRIMENLGLTSYSIIMEC
ncbi:MAG: methylenetetrahydrofolate reductase [Salinispira sp.]